MEFIKYTAICSNTIAINNAVCVHYICEVGNKIY